MPYPLLGQLVNLAGAAVLGHELFNQGKPNSLLNKTVGNIHLGGFGSNNPETDVGKNLGRVLSNIKIGTNNPETDVGKNLRNWLFNKNITERTGSSGNAGGAQSIDPSGSGYIEPLGSDGYDELQKQWAREVLTNPGTRPIVQSSIPIATPVIEGMSEWEAAKKAQDMALADQLGMEIWARENSGLAAAVAERARIRGTNQTDNPLMRDFRSQLPSPTDSTATTGIPATPGFQSLLENIANQATATADDGTSLVDPEKLIDPDTLLKLKDGTYVNPRALTNWEPVGPFLN